jgi:NAD(P)H-dependent FMN reductase
MTVKILSLAGSARNDSLNRKLVISACEILKRQGADVKFVEMAEYPLPLYDGDLEAQEGLPDKVVALKTLFRESQALLISSPEYNSSISPLLKNVIDWVSRPSAGEQSLECFAGKTAGLLAASPGALGGLRGLVHLRSILGNIKVHVIPEQFALSQAHEAFDENGELRSESARKSVAAVCNGLHKTATALAG